MILVSCISIMPDHMAASDYRVTAAATVTAEATALPTLTPTLTSTPTLAPTETATPTIIEIPVPTPGEVWDILGSYTPFNRLNIRSCARTDCDRVGLLQAGAPVDVYGMVVVAGDVWLCLDVSYTQGGVYLGSQCGQLVAYQIDGHVYGELQLK
jgi:hypothetical protein